MEKHKVYVGDEVTLTVDDIEYKGVIDSLEYDEDKDVRVKFHVKHFGTWREEDDMFVKVPMTCALVGDKYEIGEGKGQDEKK